MLNSHYKDILSILSEKKIKFIMVGAYGINIHVLSISDLIINKQATGRTKDLADAEALSVIQDSEPHNTKADI